MHLTPVTKISALESELEDAVRRIHCLEDQINFSKFIDHTDKTSDRDIDTDHYSAISVPSEVMLLC